MHASRTCSTAPSHGYSAIQQDQQGQLMATEYLMWLLRIHFVIVDLPPERLVQHLHILDHGKMLGVVRVKGRFNTDLPHFVVLCL